MLFDIESGTWDKNLCELFEVPMVLLPKVMDCSGLLAKTNKGIYAGKNWIAANE
jgi:glycerol kinase